MAYRLFDHPLNLETDKPNVIIFSTIQELYVFYKHLSVEIEKGDDLFEFIDGASIINTQKSVEVISSLVDLSLNNRKTINALHKKLVNNVNDENMLFEFNEITKSFISWMERLKKQSFFYISYNSDYALSDFFKFIDVKYIEEEYNIGFLLTKYTELLLSISKIKIICLVLGGYLLTEEELSHYINYCKNNGIILLLLEKQKPAISGPINSWFIANNSVLE